jgi:hypothetical protein
MGIYETRRAIPMRVPQTENSIQYISYGCYTCRVWTQNDKK